MSDETTPAPTPAPRYLKTREACRYLEVSRSTLYRDAPLLDCASRVGAGRGRLRWDRNAIDLVMALRSKRSAA